MDTLLLAHYALAALSGLILGVIFTWLAMRGNRALFQEKMRENEALAQQFSAYRSQVDRHFIDTAEAVDELNRSYQKVVQHLSAGAQSLMDKEALQAQLALRGNKAVTVAYLAEAEQIKPAEPQVEMSAEEVSDKAEEQPEAVQPAEDELQTSQTEEPSGVSETLKSSL